MAVSDLMPARQTALDSSKRGEFLYSATFRIETENGMSAVFSELGGISSEVEQVEYMEAGEKGPAFGRFIGRAKPPTVTLKRAVTKGDSPDQVWIWEWHQACRQGGPTAYRNLFLSLIPAGPEGASMAKHYSMTNSILTKVEIAGMKAGGTEVVMQTVTIQCDEIT